MRILEKYVLKSFIGAFLFCITLLIVLGIIGDILGFLDDIFKNNIPLESILAFYFYLAPFAFVNMVPFACLLSAVYVFNNLSKNHEITAVIANGISIWKLLWSVLLVTFMLCLVTFIVNDQLVPWTMEKANRIRREKLEVSKKTKGENGAMEVKDIAIYGKGNQLIFAKAFTPSTKVLSDVIVHKQDESHRIIEKVNARIVRWHDDGFWYGEDVMVFRADPEGNFSRDPEMYKVRKIAIAENPREFRETQCDPKFMSYGQLKRYLKMFNAKGTSSIRRLLVDLNYKIAFPFTAIITVLVGVPFSIATGRASALIGMAKGITVAILYLPVMAVSLALGKGGVLPPFLSVWLSYVLFAGIGIHYVNKKS